MTEWKEGDGLMQAEFIWLDQTLGEALRKDRVAFPAWLALKAKLAGLGKILFDLPLEQLTAQSIRAELDPADFRLETAPDPAQIERAFRLRCTRIKIPLNPELFAKTGSAAYAAAFAMARRYGMEVTVHGLDIATLSAREIDFFQNVLSRYAIDYWVADDTRSRLDPLATQRRLSDLQSLFPGRLEYWGRNAMGLAAGNALGAAKSGVRRIAVAIGGYGGYPASEEVWMGLKHLLGFPINLPEQLAITCREVLAMIGEGVPAAKPIIGTDIFAHESGIHVDGIIKKSELYEPFPPEEVGLTRRIVLGKHSGQAAVRYKLEELNLPLGPAAFTRVLEKVRALSVVQKGPVGDGQLRQLAREVACEWIGD